VARQSIDPGSWNSHRRSRGHGRNDSFKALPNSAPLFLVAALFSGLGCAESDPDFIGALYVDAGSDTGSAGEANRILLRGGMSASVPVSGTFVISEWDRLCVTTDETQERDSLVNDRFWDEPDCQYGLSSNTGNYTFRMSATVFASDAKTAGNPCQFNVEIPAVFTVSD
jgi:hypothetical protein